MPDASYKHLAEVLCILSLLSLAVLAQAEIYAPPLPLGGGISRPGSLAAFSPPGIGVAGTFGPGGGFGGSISLLGPGGNGVSGLGTTVGLSSGGGINGPSSFSVGFAPAAPGGAGGGSGGLPVGAPGSSGFLPQSASFTPGISGALSAPAPSVFAPPPRVPASVYGPPDF
ncbi:glycine-rich protein 5-like [Ischnura elegans]|uniref:glycine-rich protein 5-like n=1 Tax=Ischnura elegans TaxID=197161 RepID=UPI001ED8AC93|nr:glycine-rich protein 5-like [Ischnura elegans]